MTLYKANNKYTTGMKLIGVHIPKQDANQIALYCLKNKKTRSEIYKGLVNSFLKEISNTNQLINDIVKECFIDFKSQNKSFNKSINKYTTQLKIDLKIKKISEDSIQEIVNKLKAYNEKN